MMKPAHRLAAFLLALSVAACASNPPALVALPGPPQPDAARRPDANLHATVLLRQVTLPGYLDGYAIVVGRKANTLAVSDEAEWAERPRDGVTRVLRDALSQRLGAGRVLVRDEHRVADAELVVEFLKLDPADGALQLDARWSFVCTARERPAHTGRTALQAQLAAATAPAVAAATVDALARFAEVLAAQEWCNNVARAAGPRY
jgi:uncharacterized lipoprotein YmbA